jgi:cell division protein FtsL
VIILKIEPVLLIVFLVIAILFIMNELNKNNNKITLILEKVDKLSNKISDKNTIATNIAGSKSPIGFNPL